MLSLKNFSLVIAGLVPAISFRRAVSVRKRDGRVKPGHDRLND